MSRPLTRITLTAFGLAVAGETAVADTAYGRVCNRVLATKAYSHVAGRAMGHSQKAAIDPNAAASCNASWAIAEDNRGAGLDYAPSIGLATVDGGAVSGCLRFDFPLNRGWVLAGIDVTAKPIANACSLAGTPCQAPHCGTGGDFVVFTAQYNSPWKRVKVVTAATPNWAEYKVLLPEPAPLVMVCRSGSGPARDDVLIDSVKGCAVQINYPLKLERSMITAGVDSVKSQVLRCRKGLDEPYAGTVKLTAWVTPDGTVSRVKVTEAPDPMLGECMADELKAARFAKTQRGGSFSYPF